MADNLSPFEITSPSGGVYRLNAPDRASAQKYIEDYEKFQKEGTSEGVGTFVHNVAQTIPKTATDTIGLVGELPSMLYNNASYLPSLGGNAANKLLYGVGAISPEAYTRAQGEFDKRAEANQRVLKGLGVYNPLMTDKSQNIPEIFSGKDVRDVYNNSAAGRTTGAIYNNLSEFDPNAREYMRKAEIMASIALPLGGATKIAGAAKNVIVGSEKLAANAVAKAAMASENAVAKRSLADESATLAQGENASNVTGRAAIEEKLAMQAEKKAAVLKTEADALTSPLNIGEKTASFAEGVGNAVKNSALMYGGATTGQVIGGGDDAAMNAGAIGGLLAPTGISSLLKGGVNLTNSGLAQGAKLYNTTTKSNMAAPVLSMPFQGAQGKVYGTIMRDLARDNPTLSRFELENMANSKEAKRITDLGGTTADALSSPELMSRALATSDGIGDVAQIGLQNKSKDYVANLGNKIIKGLNRGDSADLIPIATKELQKQEGLNLQFGAQIDEGRKLVKAPEQRAWGEANPITEQKMPLNLFKGEGGTLPISAHIDILKEKNISLDQLPAATRRVLEAADNHAKKTAQAEAFTGDKNLTRQHLLKKIDPAPLSVNDFTKGLSDISIAGQKRIGGAGNNIDGTTAHYFKQIENSLRSHVNAFENPVLKEARGLTTDFKSGREIGSQADKIMRDATNGGEAVLAHNKLESVLNSNSYEQAQRLKSIDTSLTPIKGATPEEITTLDKIRASNQDLVNQRLALKPQQALVDSKGAPETVFASTLKSNNRVEDYKTLTSPAIAAGKEGRWAAASGTMDALQKAATTNGKLDVFKLKNELTMPRGKNGISLAQEMHEAGVISKTQLMHTKYAAKKIEDAVALREKALAMGKAPPAATTLDGLMGSIVGTQAVSATGLAPRGGGSLAVNAAAAKIGRSVINSLGFETRSQILHAALLDPKVFAALQKKITASNAPMVNSQLAKVLRANGIEILSDRRREYQNIYADERNANIQGEENPPTRGVKVTIPY